jgi:hypothetical protein
VHIPRGRSLTAIPVCDDSGDRTTPPGDEEVSSSDRVVGVEQTAARDVMRPTMETYGLTSCGTFRAKRSESKPPAGRQRGVTGTFSQPSRAK